MEKSFGKENPADCFAESLVAGRWSLETSSGGISPLRIAGRKKT